MILCNGLVVDENFTLKKCDVEIENGKIVKIGENLKGDNRVDLNGKYLLPGFVDTHIHGAYGTRISDDNFEYEKTLRFEVTQGVTSIAITPSPTANIDKLMGQVAAITEIPKIPHCTKIMGIHFEGPFLNANKKGAMLEKNLLDADIKLFDEICAITKGMLKIMTVAPEIDGADELIKYATSKGVQISMGHTIATYDEAMKGIEAGANAMTHTFNASRSIHHREPGVLVAALNDDRVFCEVICDFIHVHKAVIEMIHKLKGRDKMVIISDSGSAAGINASVIECDERILYIKDGVVTLADGTIAGSSKTMADGVKNLINMGIPVEDVSKMASYNPAIRLNAENEIGSIAVGKVADLVILNENYDVDATIIDGELAFGTL